MMSLGNDIRFLLSKERRHSEGLLFLLLLELGLGLVGLRKWWIFFCALSSVCRSDFDIAASFLSHWSLSVLEAMVLG